jgi:S-DNA-T family DNA segregation ATPase FtsK/SpoIIIE
LVATAKHSAKKRPAKKAPARSNARSSAPDTLWTRHRRDLWILALGVLGVVLALAEISVLGPVGHAVETAMASLLGVARWFVPVMLIGLGVALLWGKVEVERLRLSIGFSCAVVGISGLADLGGRPSWSASSNALGRAGGWLGVGVGGGLSKLIGLAGAVVILVALLVVAMLFLTQVPLRTLVGGFVRAVKFVGAWIAQWWRVSPKATDDDLIETRERPTRRRLDPDIESAVQYVQDDAVEPDSDANDESYALEHEAEEPEQQPSLSVVTPITRARKSRVNAPALSNGQWELPSLDLLQRVKEQKHDRSAIDAAGDELVDALAAHGVETTLVGYTVGPTVTRFELELGPGVKVARVTSLHRDIAYAMASPDVRILAPIPGRSAIGVEVPNRQRTLVALGDLLATEESRKALHPLDVPLGRDISGKTVIVNLAEMPHVLISGATGAGKSSCINSLITSLVMRATPDQLRLILVDPKRVELGQYNDLPHLLSPVVVDPKKAAGALAWAVKEMERRYDLLAEYHVRDLASYQAMLARGEITTAPHTREQVATALESANVVAERGEPTEPEVLPYIVIVVDELNDLMMVAARDVEESVVRIAQMARAVGIHLVLATQRPSVDVITGVIKANIPSRMAFAVSSLADSRVILDQAGAERLIGKGDMLLLTASSNVSRRLQSPWVSEEEVRRVVSAWRAQGGTRETVVALDLPEASSSSSGYADDDDDVVLAQARELVIRTQSGSTSMLQRKLRVGFARAGRLMDQLEIEGVVAAGEGSKARKVLVTLEEYERQRSSS